MKNRIWNKVVDILMTEQNVRYYDISVKRICEELSIHRSTFYRYFDSKFDLLEYGITVLWDEYSPNSHLNNLKNPFQYANSFYEFSFAKRFIHKQIQDTELLEDIKRITLHQLKKSYEENIVGDPEFYSSFIIANIDFLDDWNQRQKKSDKDLDLMLNELVLSNVVFKKLN